MNEELVEKVKNHVATIKAMMNTAPVYSRWVVGEVGVGTEFLVVGYSSQWNDESQSFTGPMYVVLSPEMVVGHMLMTVKSDDLLKPGWTRLEDQKPG